MRYSFPRFVKKHPVLLLLFALLLLCAGIFFLWWNRPVPMRQVSGGSYVIEVPDTWIRNENYEDPALPESIAYDMPESIYGMYVSNLQDSFSRYTDSQEEYEQQLSIYRSLLSGDPEPFRQSYESRNGIAWSSISVREETVSGIPMQRIRILVMQNLNPDIPSWFWGVYYLFEQEGDLYLISTDLPAFSGVNVSKVARQIAESFQKSDGF